MRAGRVEIDADSHILTETDITLPVTDTKDTPQNRLNQFYI